MEVSCSTHSLPEGVVNHGDQVWFRKCPCSITEYTPSYTLFEMDQTPQNAGARCLEGTELRAVGQARTDFPIP